jgi:hypothetical protein
MLETTSAPVGLGSSATELPGLAPGSGTDPGDPGIGPGVLGAPGYPDSINKKTGQKTSTNTEGFTEFTRLINISQHHCRRTTAMGK